MGQQLAHPPAAIERNLGLGAAPQHRDGIHLVCGSPLQDIGHQARTKPGSRARRAERFRSFRDRGLCGGLDQGRAQHR